MELTKTELAYLILALDYRVLDLKQNDEDENNDRLIRTCMMIRDKLTGDYEDEQNITTKENSK